MIGPAAGLVGLLLLVALIASPGSLLVRVSVAPEVPVAAGEPVTPSAQAALPRAEPDLRAADPAAQVTARLAELLVRRDVAVRSGRDDGWSTSGVAADDDALAVLASMPVTRFESSLVAGSLEPLTGGSTEAGSTGAGTATADDPSQQWQARVDTVYELADGPVVERTDSVVLAPAAAPATPGEDTSAALEVVSWTPYPQEGEIGTAAPWDLGPVSTTVGERAVVLSWHPQDVPGDDSALAADSWGEQVGSWADSGAVTVDSYLGTGWPRLSLVLAPATAEQYAELVPGPRPATDDVFAAVTTDVRTPDGGGDVVVLNPLARDDLVDQTWQVTVTHELVHVASGAIYGDEQDIWLAEGFADLVGWSTVVPGVVDRDVVAARLLQRVAAGTTGVEELPGPEQFGASDADVVGDAYEGAWLAVLLLEDQIGTDALLDLYATASQGEGAAGARTERALVAATGEGRDAFEDRWGEHLRRLATG
ncbi:hypothetical protein [Aquipuribacter sp. MA13-6]|uniref:hypothetical protein n=1 Tax=unclassified Aquipuribacter TaxID=2635084 RepID=UPI003EE8701C